MNIELDINLLKKSAHHLKPVVQIGKNGLTPKVIDEIKSALLAHELIKVQILSKEKLNLADYEKKIALETGAKIIMTRGKIITLFLAKPKED